VLPYDGKRTLANAALASLVRRTHHSLEQCGTPSRELEQLLGKRDQAPRKIPVTEHGAPAKLKMT
jgi:hypothetical protein